MDSTEARQWQRTRYVVASTLLCLDELIELGLVRSRIDIDRPALQALVDQMEADGELPVTFEEQDRCVGILMKRYELQTGTGE